MITQLKPDWQSFERYAKSRGVDTLVHFTPALNLATILEAGGILSREGLHRWGEQHPEMHLQHFIRMNDELRLDNLTEYVNLSVTIPNSQLLRAFRTRLIRVSDGFRGWCVLKIDVSVAWNRDTLFSVSNAASNMAKANRITGDIEKFAMLFEGVREPDNRLGRAKRYDVPVDTLTCDEQAEVLVRDIVPLESVKEICFQSEEDKVRYVGGLMISHPKQADRCREIAAVDRKLFA